MSNTIVESSLPLEQPILKGNRDLIRLHVGPEVSYLVGDWHVLVRFGVIFIILRYFVWPLELFTPER